LELCQSFSASIHPSQILRIHIVPSLQISGRNISVHHFQHNNILLIIFAIQILYLFQYTTGDFVIWNNIHVVDLYMTTTFHDINLAIFNLMHRFLYLFIYNTFIKILYMFRAVRCSSSGGLIVSMQHLISSLSVGNSPVRQLTIAQDSHLQTVTMSDAA
jgi:hypothetical protein